MLLAQRCGNAKIYRSCGSWHDAVCLEHDIPHVPKLVMLLSSLHQQFVTHSLCCDFQSLYEEEVRARQSECERADIAEQALSNTQRQLSLAQQDADNGDNEQVRLPFLSFPLLSFPLLSCPVLSCSVLSCPVLSCPVLSCPFLSATHSCSQIYAIIATHSCS